MPEHELSADFERLAKPAFTPFADNRRRGTDQFTQDSAANAHLFDGDRRSEIDRQVAEMVPDHYTRSLEILTGFEHLTNGDASRVQDLTALLKTVEESAIEEGTNLGSSVDPSGGSRHG